MMELELTRWDPDAEGLPSAQRFCTELEEKGYFVTEVVYQPGTVFPPHSHDADKVEVVLSGRFRLSLDKVSVVLEPGDTLVVPKGAMHSAEVLGMEPVHSLDAVLLD